MEDGLKDLGYKFLTIMKPGLLLREELSRTGEKIFSFLELVLKQIK